MEGSERYISRTRHEPVAFPRTIPLPGRLLVPAIRRELDHLSIAPDLDGQALPSVLDKHSLHSSLERHFGALFQRQVQNVCGGLCHGFPQRAISPSVVNLLVHYTKAREFLKGNDLRRDA